MNQTRLGRIIGQGGKVGTVGPSSRKRGSSCAHAGPYSKRNFDNSLKEVKSKTGNRKRITKFGLHDPRLAHLVQIPDRVFDGKTVRLDSRTVFMPTEEIAKLPFQGRDWQVYDGTNNKNITDALVLRPGYFEGTGNRKKRTIILTGTRVTQKALKALRDTYTTRYTFIKESRSKPRNQESPNKQESERRPAVNLNLLHSSKDTQRPSRSSRNN